MSQAAQDLSQSEYTDLIDVRTTITDDGVWTKKVNIVVPQKAVADVYDKIVGSVAEQARIPGFRPGKVPRAVIEKKFGKEIGSEATKELLQRATLSAIRQSELDLIGSPELDSDRIQPLERHSPYTFDLHVEVRPVFELCQYKGLKVEQEELEVFDSEVEHQLLHLTERQARQIDAPEGAAVQLRDVVEGTLSFVVDGEEIHTEEGKLVVQQNKIFGGYTDLSADWLLGAKAGERKTTEGVLKDIFPIEVARGKTATVAFELKNIKRLEIPAQDDELAKQFGFETFTELRQRVLENLRQQISRTITTKLHQDLLNQIVAGTPFEIPPRFKKTLEENMLKERLQQMAQMGVSREKLLEYQEDIVDVVAQSAEQEIRHSLLIQAICKQENIQVSDDELDEEILKLAKENGMRVNDLFQQLVESGELSGIQERMLIEKGINFIQQHAQIEVVPRKKPENTCQDHPDHH